MILNVCEQSSFLGVFYYVKSIIEIVSLVVPLILIVSLGIEIFKIVVGKTESINSHMKSIASKSFAAIIIFFLPLITSLVVSFATGNKIQESLCWTNANKETIEAYRLVEEAKEKTEQAKRDEEKKKAEEERKRVAEAREKARIENEKKAEEERQKKEKTGRPLSVGPGMKSATTSRGLKYWEFVPNNPTTNMALIVFLHGAGEVCNLNAMIGVSFPANMNNGVYKDYKAIFLAPNTCGDWYSVDAQVMALIEEKVAEYQIDKDRIVVTGHSLGGNGAWNFVGRHPGYFSALVPVSGCPNHPASSYTKIPIRSYIGAAEGGYRRCNEGFVGQIKSLGGNAQFIAVPAPHNTHSGVVHVYQDPELINWMINQSKSGR